MNTRRIPLLAGLILAFGTGVLMLNYLNSVRAQTATATQPRKVLIAVRDIPARAPITAEMLGTANRLASEVDSDAFDDPAKAVNHLSLITIPAGSTITASKVATFNALALPRRLANGLRAVSISIDRVKGVSGLIQPGDRIDVIAVPPRVSNETPKATTILRGALVLAMGAEMETARATPPPEAPNNLTTVTLAVTPQQADLLALADVNTTLRLALRPPEEPIRAFPAEPLQLGVTPQAPPPQSAPVVAQPHPGAPAQVAVARRAEPPKNQFVVPVIDGDRLVRSTGEH